MPFRQEQTGPAKKPTVLETSRRPARIRDTRWSLAASREPIHTVQELLGHSHVRTTMIYTHVLNRGGRGVRSPADVLARRPDER
ncbi:MAG: tyrosine-type recombinase/integrase [Thermoguttaceae bacterium]